VGKALGTREEMRRRKRKRKILTRRARRLDTEGHGEERDWGMGQENCERGGAEESGEE
jgi:hypothetical protein